MMSMTFARASHPAAGLSGRPPLWMSAALGRICTLAVCLAISWGPGLASGPELEVPRVIPVPPTQARPLSSAVRAGTEYADLAAAGYVEEEFYLQGIAPAITAAGESVFSVPYITRILVRRPKDPVRFNGTVVIEPFTWIGERGAGWILTKDYLLRNGYAEVGYTLNTRLSATCRYRLLGARRQTHASCAPGPAQRHRGRSQSQHRQPPRRGPPALDQRTRRGVYDRSGDALRVGL